MAGFRWVCHLACGLVILTVMSPLFASQLTHILVRNQSKIVHLDLVLTQPITPPRVFILHQPERLVIDLAHTSARFNLRSLTQSNPLIRQARLGYPKPQLLRVVLELNQAVSIKSNKWQRGWQISMMPRGYAPTRSMVTHHNSSKVIQAPRAANRDVIVVLDPGHGGKDPGAMGMKRTQEKHIVLAIAKKLKTLIDRQPGMRAVLTRNGDYYIGLRERMTIARRHNADLFIAIHADAFDNRQSHGASVFALSQRGATSEAARWLAAKENYSELGGVNLSELDDRNGIIRSVLIDLSQTATISSSLHLGRLILYGLNRMTSLHSHKVEQARFMVLKSPDIPSLLIETGFISNPREEMNLNNAAYQMRLSQAIMGGIKQYFIEFPPHGS
ncbi:MAG TPA: N-acetylmuramoyl-L-alanine amidase, partial [Legionellaceae bacterium]|nr:N-acetylmuramoyl-L-alanine amidase [Legionellaceae bacterium]